MKIFKAGDNNTSPAAETGSIGARMEEVAASYLAAAGITVVEQNYRTRCGEIDLVARDGDSLVFVEVRYRRSAAFGGAAASVDRRKQRKLLAAAESYLQQRRLDCPCRFDVVAIEGSGDDRQIQWIQSAFNAL
ncbi:YraN family protein [Microbulbifer guangxiensis]|uniref:YraN family protein n=1 Tax=Microbulbifer guangxiensis TaxID=2904249 RepID=UPI001F012E43